MTIVSMMNENVLGVACKFKIVTKHWHIHQTTKGYFKTYKS